MRLERKALRKLIIKTLLKEASDTKPAGTKKVVSEEKDSFSNSKSPQKVSDKSGNDFSISPEGNIDLLTNQFVDFHWCNIFRI
jgi:hypothetical protein